MDFTCVWPLWNTSQIPVLDACFFSSHVRHCWRLRTSNVMSCVVMAAASTNIKPQSMPAPLSGNLTPDVFRTPATLAFSHSSHSTHTYAVGRERAILHSLHSYRSVNIKRNHRMQGNPTSLPPDAGRRTLVSWLLGGGVAASLASVFYSVARFLDPPLV